MPAADRPPAPEPLDLVEAFVNTLDRQRGADALATPADLAAWLGRNGLGEDGARVSAAELAGALELREALRALLAEHNGEAPEPAAIAVVNRAMAAAGPVVRFLPAGGVELGATAPGVAGALGHLLGIAFAAVADGNWERLKACHEPRCQRAFYDHARNRTGTWCDMATCGSRAKMRAYYQRRRAADMPEPVKLPAHGPDR
jgi:predicted RNA-binding Zn ribbon-like protein